VAGGQGGGVGVVRVGTLGAARITPTALIRPARQVPEVVVTAVAAREPARAREFADRHNIPVVHPTYEALIASPEIDAIYNPLPNGLHAPWTLRAIAAGKHVLCEKPFTSNEAEAAEVAEAASKAAGVVVMEAFHYRYHPLARRMLIAAGEIGELRHVEAALCFPLPRFSDIRYRFDLAGGATMDAGCYAINCIRMLGQGEPKVTAARAKLHGADVDRAMIADFRFPGGATGRIRASLWSAQPLRVSAKATGERGEMRVLNYLAPQAFSLLSIRTTEGRRWERVRGQGTTYTYQLRAFAGAVLRGEPVITSADDAVANMRQIDDVYRAAGLPPRGRQD